MHLDFRDCSPTSKWIDRLNGDSSLLLRAIELWQLEALNLADACLRAENGEVQIKIPTWYDLQLLSRAKAECDMPRKGECLVILANVNNAIFFRVFNHDGNMMIDVDETELSEKKRQIIELKELLFRLWKVSPLPKKDKHDVITAINAILGYALSEHFVNLTDLLIAYCDRYTDRIDPTALQNFKLQALAYKYPTTGHGPAPQFHDLEHVRSQCLRILERLHFHCTYLPASADVEAQANGDDEIIGPHEQRGPFGVIVDLEKRTVRRKGRRPIELESAGIQYHIFRVVFEARGEAADTEMLRNGYPGEWDARYAACNALNKSLKSLGISVKRWALVDDAEA